jgi:hypothetical protein
MAVSSAVRVAEDESCQYGRDRDHEQELAEADLAKSGR